jgi:hypothetical protein
MTTDILTKFLPKEKHFHYVSNLGMDFVFLSNDYPHSQPNSHALMVYMGVFSHKHSSSIKNMPSHLGSFLDDPKSLEWKRLKHLQPLALKSKASCTSSFIKHKYRNYLPKIGTSSYSWLDRIESPNRFQLKKTCPSLSLNAQI